MCQDLSLSRRQLLRGASVLAGAAVLANRAPTALAGKRLCPGRLDASGDNAYSMAMHIHSSFSEQSGSMWDQLTQAKRNGVDVLWWTDHDWRMDGLTYRDQVHFTGLTEMGGKGQGGDWVWAPQQAGPLASSSPPCGIVKTPSSPNDPVQGGAMSLGALTSSPGVQAQAGYYCNTGPGRHNNRGNLTGQTITLDVLLPVSGWTAADGYVEFYIRSSTQESSGGRPAGEYTLTYQFVPGTGPVTSTAHVNAGIITIPVNGSGGPTVTLTPASGGSGWVTVSMTPGDDIRVLWRDLPDWRDFALWQFWLYAVSVSKTPVTGYVDYLTFDRTISGQGFFSQQAEMMATLGSAFPGVTQQQGTEISWMVEHFNWFGPHVQIPSYAGVTGSGYLKYVLGTVIPGIHVSGGLVSLNHPYGYGDGPLLPPQQQRALMRQIAAQWLGTVPTAGGCDLLEVGYPKRAGVDLNHHLGLWDVMSRNSVFLTGNGTSDDHLGQDWRGIGNNWVTSVWAPSTGSSDLLAALAAGHAWCGSLSAFPGGTLDMLVDGACPMGSVSLSALPSRSLQVSAAGMPAGSVLNVLQGIVDNAGPAQPMPDTARIASIPAAKLASRPVTMRVDNSRPSFARIEVATSLGRVIAVSNPVWMLHNPPPGGIPAPRQV